MLYAPKTVAKPRWGSSGQKYTARKKWHTKRMPNCQYISAKQNWSNRDPFVINKHRQQIGKEKRKEENAESTFQFEDEYQLNHNRKKKRKAYSDALKKHLTSLTSDCREKSKKCTTTFKAKF